MACRNRGKRDKPGTPKLRHRISRHAVKRYIERCAPQLVEQYENNGRRHQIARLEMQERMARAEWGYEWPDWLSGRGLHGAGIDDAPGHLRIDDSTVFVLARSRKRRMGGDEIVVTVLTRDGALVV